jgi:hypothetical protein
MKRSSRSLTLQLTLVLAATAVASPNDERSYRELIELSGAVQEEIVELAERAVKLAASRPETPLDHAQKVAAIRQLGLLKVEKATGVLAKELDYAPPMIGTSIGRNPVAQLFPAAEALRLIGIDAVEVILNELKLEQSSRRIRLYAYVLREIYRDRDLAVLKVDKQLQAADAKLDALHRHNLECVRKALKSESLGSWEDMLNTIPPDCD